MESVLFCENDLETVLRRKYHDLVLIAKEDGPLEKEDLDYFRGYAYGLVDLSDHLLPHEDGTKVFDLYMELSEKLYWMKRKIKLEPLDDLPF